MAQVALILDPAGGMAEVRLIPGAATRLADPDLFMLAGRLGPVIRALDEASWVHPLRGERSPTPAPEASGTHSAG